MTLTVLGPATNDQVKGGAPDLPVLARPDGTQYVDGVDIAAVNTALSEKGRAAGEGRRQRGQRGGGTSSSAWRRIRMVVVTSARSVGAARSLMCLMTGVTEPFSSS